MSRDDYERQPGGKLWCAYDEKGRRDVDQHIDDDPAEEIRREHKRLTEKALPHDAVRLDRSAVDQLIAEFGFRRVVDALAGVSQQAKFLHGAYPKRRRSA